MGRKILAFALCLLGLSLMSACGVDYSNYAGNYVFEKLEQDILPPDVAQGEFGETYFELKADGSFIWHLNYGKKTTGSYRISGTEITFTYQDTDGGRVRTKAKLEEDSIFIGVSEPSLNVTLPMVYTLVQEEEEE